MVLQRRWVTDVPATTRKYTGRVAEQIEGNATKRSDETAKRLIKLS